MSSSSEEESSRLVGLARALADPLRLQILEQLMAGPCAVSELVVTSGASQPNISNHLAVLRDCRLVKVSSIGRQKLYELAGLEVARLVESLVAISGTAAPVRSVVAGIAEARTCYDHLAGKLGVALFDALVDCGAIDVPVVGNRPVGRDRGKVTLGPAGTDVFGRLDVDVDAARRQRRTFASYCIDWSERRPHLSGALGAGVWRSLLEKGWVVRQPGSREVIFTRTGRVALRRLFGSAFDFAGGGS